MSFKLKVNDVEFKLVYNDEFKFSTEECLYFENKKIYYFIFSIASEIFLITSKCNLNRLESGIKKDQFILLKNFELDKDKIININKIKCGDKIIRIAGNDELDNPRNFKRTIKIENIEYTINFSV